MKDTVHPEKYDYLVNFCKGFTCSDDLSGGKDAVVSCCCVLFVCLLLFCVCGFSISQRQFLFHTHNLNVDVPDSASFCFPVCLCMRAYAWEHQLS